MVPAETKIELRVFLTTIIVLGVMVLLAGFSSYFIQAGELVPMEQDGRSVQVYKAIDQTPIPIWKILLSPLLCITGKNGVKIIVLILFILIIGGSFAILNGSGVLPGIVSGLVTKFSDRRRLFLVINVIVFSLMGSCLGILEEIAPMVLIFVPLSHRMGWDSITGVAIPFLSAGFGFAAATFNPFTVGTAQKLADVALFSGLSLRIPFFMLTTLTVILYLLHYTRKIEKNPEKSLTYKMDLEIKKAINFDMPVEQGGVNSKTIVWLAISFLLVAGVVISGTMIQIVQDLAFPLIMLIFFAMGVGGGILAGCRVKTVFGYFLRGLADFSPAIVLVLMAASVGYLIEVGNILDTILFNLSDAAQHYGKETAVFMIYGFQILMNGMVPSGSGQAFLTIPILAPLGDILGISRQTVVLAYQFGDGFSNLIWPTNALLLIVIGLGKVSYKVWFRWILPIQVILLGLCSAALFIAVKINYV
jgi:uncharacterized ion transporter superfamily protein YfcC